METESKIATKDSMMGEDVAEAVLGVDEDSKVGIQSWQPGPPKADPDAREKIPTAWTVSRNLPAKDLPMTEPLHRFGYC